MMTVSVRRLLTSAGSTPFNSGPMCHQAGFSQVVDREPIDSNCLIGVCNAQIYEPRSQNPRAADKHGGSCQYPETPATST